MPRRLIVSIPHNLGKDEAIRRLNSGLSVVQVQFGTLFSVQDQTWVDNRLSFRIAALGQCATGTIDIAEDHARLEVWLPSLLARAAEQIQRVVQNQGKLLLEKK
jgi:hypothetical protein